MKLRSDIGACGVATFSWTDEGSDFQLVWSLGSSWLFGCKDIAGQWVYRSINLAAATTGQAAFRIASAWVEQA